jgi:hypothetical protein
MNVGSRRLLMPPISMNEFCVKKPPQQFRADVVVITAHCDFEVSVIDLKGGYLVAGHIARMVRVGGNWSRGRGLCDPGRLAYVYRGCLISGRT